MGAWIEIIKANTLLICPAGRTPRWVRGLKSVQLVITNTVYGRTPRWVRGLKLCAVCNILSP